MSAGAEIKRLRGRISAQEAASLIGVDVERLRKWESRNVDPKDSDDIRAIESYFGLPLKDLPTLDNFQFVPRVTIIEDPSVPYEGKSSLERSIENLTQNELRTTAVIERLVSLLEMQYQKPGVHNMDKNGTENLRHKKTSSKAG